MAANGPKPDTIVLINGLWMTALSWEHWAERYKQKGFKVVARSWPGMEGDIEELRRNPPKEIGNLGVTEIADHYEAVVREQSSPPIIMGHSFGGLFTQILVDRRHGSELPQRRPSTAPHDRRRQGPHRASVHDQGQLQPLQEVKGPH